MKVGLGLSGKCNIIIYMYGSRNATVYIGLDLRWRSSVAMGFGQPAMARDACCTR